MEHVTAHNIVKIQKYSELNLGNILKSRIQKDQDDALWTM